MNEAVRFIKKYYLKILFMKQSDWTIENKYIKKIQYSLFYNYFTVIIMAWWSLGLSFFFDMNIQIMLFGIAPIILFILIFIKRNSNIITSVWIYKYSEIFMEILKSVLIKKKDINQLKVLWKQKTR